MDINSNVTKLKGVGEKVAKSLAGAGITTIADLINYFPRTYQDYSNTMTIEDLTPGLVSIRVKFSSISGGYRRGGMHITSAVADDETGKVKITWFNQPYREAGLSTEKEYFISGELSFKYGSYQIVNPNLEIASDLPKHAARVLPVYPERRNLKSRTIRSILSSNQSIFDNIEDILPSSVIEDNQLVSRGEALKQLHLPSSMQDVDRAKRRLGFEELFELQLSALIDKSEAEKWNSPRLKFSATQTKKLLGTLNFKLTNAQKKAAWQILQDIDSKSPMNRLLQGDVGSGKTIVAAMAISQTLANGWQAVLLAPTEVLAKQHLETISELIDPDEVVYLSSESTRKEKNRVKKLARESQSSVFVGTHALIQEAISFGKLGVAIIDEQHRFGVEQRQRLLNNKVTPHLLSMTATPIPRSLALTVYGEMDVSVIDELPPGRQMIKTRVVSFQDTGKVDAQITGVASRKQQVYIICPLIESSETISSKNAEEEYLRIKKQHPQLKTGLLHGKLKSTVKAETIDNFKSGKIDVLVSTTVVEVGVDVPNASLIVIEGAERFGLAQLHQLRGRVGRSKLKSSCILVTSPGAQISNRLRAMEQTNSGFKLAEIDLSIRGPGAIYGTMQHGALDLRMASIGDAKTISHVRAAAKRLLDTEDINKYPALVSRISKLRSITQLN